jgi:uncharacterized membrane protein YphA (DoxX/SURF4 family)
VRNGDAPRWIAAILTWPLLWHAARLALTSAYIIGGLTKLFDFAGAIAEQEKFGLNPGWLWATLAIIVELGGSVLVVVNRYVWLGAGGLGVLTFVAMLTANAFWLTTGHERFTAMNAFFAPWPHRRSCRRVDLRRADAPSSNRYLV